MDFLRSDKAMIYKHKSSVLINIFELMFEKIVPTIIYNDELRNNLKLVNLPIPNRKNIC